MLTLAASDSAAHVPGSGSCSGVVPDVEHYLVAARDDPALLPWLYGSLLASPVYVADCEPVLGDRGPYLEFVPTCIGRDRTLAVYTSRPHIRPPHQVADAEHVPFAEVLRGLPPGVAVVINPGGPFQHRINSTALELLRRVLAGD